jgi:DNA-binding PadR family transcriptional regulator
MFDDSMGPGRPAFAWYGGPRGDAEEEWQPWARGHHHGPPPPLARMMWRMARRFPFGPPFGPGFGPGPRQGGPRMFGHGHLKFVLLDLLQERPKHGYEMIKDLQDRSSGFYTPSAGAVYPTLQLLEDRGWVTSETVEGKKVYAITDGGRAALAEHNQEQEGPRHGPGGHHGHGGPGFGPEDGPDGGPDGWGRGRRGWGGPFGGRGGPFGREAQPELGALMREGMEVARLMRAAVLASGGDPAKLARIRGIVERAKGDLNAFLGQSSQAPNPESGSSTPSGEGPIETV